MIEVKKSLKQIFGDVNYAWQLLECEIKFQLSSHITGEDISRILQLYMRGVEKMNSMVDVRESFFKNRVTALMSRPAVIKILNKPMSKKNEAPIVESQQIKRVDTLTQIHMQQKRKQMQMRLAYGAQEHNPDNLKKMLAEQTHKETILTSKIEKIVDEHDQRLMKRIRQRKLRTMTAKSRPDIYHNSGLNHRESKEMMEKKRDEQQFGKVGGQGFGEKEPRRKARSLEPRTVSNFQADTELSVSRRRISMDFREVKVPARPEQLFKK